MATMTHVFLMAQAWVAESRQSPDRRKQFLKVSRRRHQGSEGSLTILGAGSAPG